MDENLKWHNVPPLHLFDRSNLPRDKPHSRQGKEDCTLVNSIVAAGRHHHLMSMSTFAHYSNPLGKHLAVFLKCLSSPVLSIFHKNAILCVRGFRADEGDGNGVPSLLCGP